MKMRRRGDRRKTICREVFFLGRGRRDRRDFPTLLSRLQGRRRRLLLLYIGSMRRRRRRRRRGRIGRSSRTSMALHEDSLERVLVRVCGGKVDEGARIGGADLPIHPSIATLLVRLLLLLMFMWFLLIRRMIARRRDQERGFRRRIGPKLLVLVLMLEIFLVSISDSG
jgi:hypothetical protein